MLPSWNFGDRGFKPYSGLQVSKKQTVSSSLTFLFNIVGSLRDREVTYSATDHQGSNFEACVLRAVSSHSSYNPQEVLLAQFCFAQKWPKTPFIHFFLSKLLYFCLHYIFAFTKANNVKPINILLSYFRFIWIPLLWVYEHYNLFNSFSAGIVFRPQNVTSTDVQFWRLKTIPALNDWPGVCWEDIVQYLWHLWHRLPVHHLTGYRITLPSIACSVSSNPIKVYRDLIDV